MPDKPRATPAELERAKADLHRILDEAYPDPQHPDRVAVVRSLLESIKFGRGATDALDYARQVVDLKRKKDQVAVDWRPLEWMRDVLRCIAGPFDAKGRLGADEELQKVMREGHITPSDRLRILAKRGRNMLVELGDLPTDRAAFRELLMASELKKLKEEWDESMLINSVHRLHMATMWARSGFNVFEPTADLAAGLILTDATAETPRYPFSTFAMRLPPQTIPFFAPGPDGTSCEWADTLWCEHVKSGDHEEHIVSAVRRGICVTNATVGPTVEEDMAETIEADRVTLRAAERLVHNFLIWLEATGGHRTHPQDPVPRKIQERRRDSGEVWPTEWRFGKKIKIAPELRRAAMESVLGKSQHHAVDGWKVRSRFIVRGHWRNQAHGEGRALRTRRWIEPFWKGPAGAAAWSHLYEAEEKQAPPPK